MKPRKANETDAEYIRRLETCNGSLRQRNAALTKWATKIGDAVTMLATEGSLVFQAMAEKARVRSHPSVTKAVGLFDMIAHPQWRAEDAVFPKVEWPNDWDLDPPGSWSGDADMALNSPIAAVIEYLEHRKFNSRADEIEHVYELIEGLQRALMGRVEGVKEVAGFRPVSVKMPEPKHFREMKKAELVELVSAMSWMALDLAQDMATANEWLRRDLRAATYRRVCSDLYRLSNIDTNPPPGRIDIKVIGAEEVPF